MALFVYDADSVKVGTITGIKADGVIKVGADSLGLAVYGGYIDLDSGNFTVTVWMQSGTKSVGRGYIEVCSGGQPDSIGRKAFDCSLFSTVHPYVKLDFQLFKFHKNLEVRIGTETGLDLVISKIEYVSMDDKSIGHTSHLSVVPGWPEMNDAEWLGPADRLVLRSPGGLNFLEQGRGHLRDTVLDISYPIINGVPHLYNNGDVSPFLQKDYNLFFRIHNEPHVRSPNHDEITASYQLAKSINSDFMFTELCYLHLPQRVVAELGVASGDLIRRFADLGCSTYAVDFFTWEMEDGLAHHVAEGGVPFKCISSVMCRLPFATNSLDLLYMHAALHHALPADHRDFEWSNPRNMVDCLKEIKRSLKHEGTLFLLGEGIYPDGIDMEDRQYERRCEKDLTIPYEAHYTITEYEDAFQESGMYPSLFVYQESFILKIILYEASGVKHVAFADGTKIGGDNYDLLGATLRSAFGEEVLSRVLPDWIRFR